MWAAVHLWRTLGILITHSSPRQQSLTNFSNLKILLRVSKEAPLEEKLKQHSSAVEMSVCISTQPQVIHFQRMRTMQYVLIATNEIQCVHKPLLVSVLFCGVLSDPYIRGSVIRGSRVFAVHKR